MNRRDVGDAAAKVGAEVDGGGGAPKLGDARKICSRVSMFSSVHRLLLVHMIDP